MGFGGDKFLFYTLWIYKKKVQVFRRTHLSNFLALLLAVLAFYREWPELRRMAQLVKDDWPHVGQMIQSGHVGFIDILILIIIVATVGAFIWETWGNKLTTSPQEIRFVTAMRLLLQEMEKFIYGKDREPDPDKRLEQFIDAFFKVTCNTLCGKKSVHGGLMLEAPSGENIVLFQSSEGANYPEDLVIPIPTNDGSQEKSPAGVAYQEQTLVYMPKKEKRLGWPFRFDKDAYEPSEPTKGWVSVDANFEHFRSVLCLPVAIYQKRNLATQRDLKTPLGVLNYSTNSRDPFVDRDFVMGECFSSILALVLATYRSERDERAQIRPEGPSVPSREGGTEQTL